MADQSAYADRIIYGDVRKTLREMILAGAQVDCVVTSPPYWGLRDYNHPEQLGLEQSLESYLAAQADVFDLVHEVLSKRGTLWLNMGDAYVAQRKGSDSEKTSGLTAPRDVERKPKRSHAQSFFVRYAKRTWLPRKNLIGLPWRLAFALQERGWILRDAIVWSKPNPLPESVKDRCTKSHEYIFMLTRGPAYYYNAAAIAEPRLTAMDKPVGGWAFGEGSHDTVEHNRPLEGTVPDGQLRSEPKYAYKNTKPKAGGPRRNRRSVWTIPTEAYKERHFATFPTNVVAPCILAGTKPGALVLDPYMGTGTVAAVAKSLGRRYLGIELNEADYRPLIEKRLASVAGGFDL